MSWPNVFKTSITCIMVVSTYLSAQAKVVEYNLTIAQQEIDIAGKSALGMTINGGIPGPTLRFRVGDTARIHVHNQMGVDTSIHWHGVLVPPNMDGVPYVSFPPIRPGTTFTYEFPIRHSGTYWYHSHTNLQEQKGVYGSIVFEPSEEDDAVDRDYVIMLSDWTYENTDTVLRTLKRGSDWYALDKGSAQSIAGAARIGMLGDYFKREVLRMPSMDISDITYDFFLANGQPEIVFPEKSGETARLRIINGGAGTNFHLEFSGGPMTIITADGQQVDPVKLKRFLIAIAETYDVLIQVPSTGAYELRATAQDGSGYASVWIGSGERHAAPDIPKPNLYSVMGEITLKKVFALTPQGAMGMSDSDVKAKRFDQPGMMMGMTSMNMDPMKDMKSMEHMPAHPMMPKTKGDKKPVMQSMHREATMHKGVKKYGYDFRPLAADASSSQNIAVDGMDASRPWPPYSKLKATKSTVFSKNQPVREIRLTLDGDMERYVWFLNNKPLSESDVIRIHKGEVVRFILINRTMMHHPMHLHGHFFRVVNGQGDYAPLKHTVNVAPMSTTVIEFSADEVGDWFFHCHLLYHMKSGMARVVHYEDFDLDSELAKIRPNLFEEHWFFWAQADGLSNMTEGFFTVSDTRNIFTAEWEVGWQKVDKTAWEGILTYNRYFNRFFTIFVGVDCVGEDTSFDEIRGVFGFHYLLPFNLELRAWVDTNGSVRVTLSKDLHLTPRLALLGEAQYDIHDLWEGQVSVSYTINKTFSLMGQWHSEYGWGGGLQIRL